MEVFLKSSLILPTAWLLLQSLLLMYACIFILRRWGLIRMPVAGMEYSQALLAAVLLTCLLALSACTVSVCYDTAQAYSGQPGSFISRCVLRYSLYLLVVLAGCFLLLGLTWLVLRIVLGRGLPADETVAEGNLPMAILVSGIVLGLALAIGRLMTVVLEDMAPHFVVFN